MPARRIGEIVAGKRTVTADTDLPLCTFFGLSSGDWLRGLGAHDADVAEDALSEFLQKVRPWKALQSRAGRAAICCSERLGRDTSGGRHSLGVGSGR